MTHDPEDWLMFAAFSTGLMCGLLVAALAAEWPEWTWAIILLTGIVAQAFGLNRAVILKKRQHQR